MHAVILAAVVAALVLVAPCAMAEEIHRWYDADGNVHYTQAPPPPGALKAPPRPVPVVPPAPEPARRAATPPPEPRAPARAADLAPALEAYRRGDYAAALELLRPLADAGDAGAQAQLAEMYARGAGVEPDVAEAAQWYRKAAEGGDANAQQQLGSMLSAGRGVELDPA